MTLCPPIRRELTHREAACADRERSKLERCGLAKNSRRFARVALEQAAQPRMTMDLGQQRRVFDLRFASPPFTFGLHQNFIPNIRPLMRALGVVIGDVFFAKMIQVFQAQHHKMVETFKLDRLDKPLGERLEVGRAVRAGQDINAPVLDGAVERIAEFRIAVAHQLRDRQAVTASRSDERIGLLGDPGRVGIQRRRGNDHASRLDVQVLKTKCDTGIGRCVSRIAETSFG